MRHAIILGAWILQLVVAAHAVELHALHRRHWKSRGAGDSIHFRKPDRNGSQHNGTNDCHHITPGADNSSSIALKSSDEMIWTSLNGTVGTEVSFVVEPEPGQFIVNMENFADSLESASCAEAMILRFQDTDVYQAAQNSWNWVNLGPNRTFIMVGDPELCQSGNSRDPWAVTAADFDEATLTIRLTAKEKMWGEVAYSYVIEFGTPSQNLRKRWDDQFGFPVDMTSSWPSSLISKDGSPYYKFGIDCVDCGIEGAIDITGHIAGKYVTPTEVAISVSPRGLKAEANFEVTLEGTLEDYQVTDDKEIKRIALSPYSIPKILNFGPELIFKVGYELGDIEGKAKLSTGMVAEVPNESSFEVDILPPRIQKPAGWVPTFTAKPLTLDATISAEMSFFLSTGLGVTIVALPSFAADSAKSLKTGIGLEIDLKLPKVTINTEAGYKSEGFCKDKPDSPFGVNVKVDLGFTVGVKGWEAVIGVESDVIDEDLIDLNDLVNLADKCFPLGGSSMTASQPAISIPSSPPVMTPSATRPLSQHPDVVPSASVSRPPEVSNPAVVPPTRTCTSGCGWQWVGQPAGTSWYSQNSWSLPTGYFQSNAAGQRTLNTNCIRPADLQNWPSVIPSGAPYIWENWPLGSDNADVCCFEYFSGTTCQRVAGQDGTQCRDTALDVSGREYAMAFDARSFLVYGCTGLWTAS